MNLLKELLKPRMDLLSVLVLVIVMALDSSFWLGMLQLTAGIMIVEFLRYLVEQEIDL